MLTQSPSGVPSAQSRTWSSAALAADAADDAPRLDHRGAALLHGRDEVLLDPGLIDQIRRGLPVDLRVEHVGILRGRVVAPDRHARHRRDRHADLGRELRLARLWSSRVIAVKRSRGIEPALFIAIRQLVFAGLPTTSTRTSSAAPGGRAPCPAS